MTATTTDQVPSPARTKKRSPRTESKASEAVRPKSRGWVWGLTIFASLVVAAGVFIFVRHRNAPGRVWARNLTEQRQKRIIEPLQRCFQSIKGDDIRALAAPLRDGTIPERLARCPHVTLSEISIGAMAFMTDMKSRPEVVAISYQEERGKLEQMKDAALLVQGRLGVLGREGPLPPEQRPLFARDIENLADAVDKEHDTFDRVVAAAEASDSWF